MKSIDAYLDRMPHTGYNCQDFLREVWLYLTGEDIAEKLTRLVGPFKDRRVTPSGVRGFERLNAAESPCIIVLQRKGLVPHVGVYYDARMLHLTDKGVQFQPIDIAKHYYETVRFYR